MTDPFDDEDIAAAYGRLMAGAEPPPDAAARVARRGAQRRRRRVAAGATTLAIVGAVGLGGFLVLGDEPDRQAQVAVDPTPPVPVQPADADGWPTEESCAGESVDPPSGLTCSTGERDISFRYLPTEPGTGRSPTEAGEAWSGGDPVSVVSPTTLFVLRPDGTAYAELGLTGSETGGYAVPRIESCSDGS